MTGRASDTRSSMKASWERLLDERIARAADMPRRYGDYRTLLDPHSIRLKSAARWPADLNLWPLAVCWGDWDAAEPGDGPFREDKIEELIRSGSAYQQTSRFREMVGEIAARGVTSWRKCRSVEEVHRYVAGVFELHRSIETDGYRPDPVGSGSQISVCLGRDGTFTKRGQGTHRLAIARLLRLPVVPVVVDLIHWEWAVSCQNSWPGLSMRDAVLAELGAIAQRTVAS